MNSVLKCKSKYEFSQRIQELVWWFIGILVWFQINELSVLCVRVLCCHLNWNLCCGLNIWLKTLLEHSNKSEVGLLAKRKKWECALNSWNSYYLTKTRHQLTPHKNKAKQNYNLATFHQFSLNKDMS